MIGKTGAAPTELRRVHCRQHDRGNVDGAFVVNKFGTNGIGESNNGVLCATVGGLQRNGAIGQGRTDLHDRAAVAGVHAFQSAIVP